MNEIDLEEMYVCSYCPTDKCKYCYNNNWCILSEERQQVEQNITLLTNELEMYNKMIKRVETTGKLWKETKNGEIRKISYNELLNRRKTIIKDLKIQKKYGEIKYEDYRER